MILETPLMLSEDTIVSDSDHTDVNGVMYVRVPSV